MHMLSLLLRRGAVSVSIMLSACAATGPAPVAIANDGHDYGAFLAARYAAAHSDPNAASQFYGKALAADPHNQELIAEGFLAAVEAGSKQAAMLARQVPGNNALALMVEGNQAALDGDYHLAAQRFGLLAHQDLTGLIKPLLLAWSIYGQGNTQAALARLAPYVQNGNFGDVYVLNAALIADAGGDKQDATRFYAQAAGGQPNLRLAEILASWQARQGDADGATATLTGLVATHPDLALALPALQAHMDRPVVATGRDGIAEAYLTLAGALDQTPQLFLRSIFLRFALDLRPDLTPARLLLANAEIGGGLAGGDPTDIQLQNALDVLRPVRPDDVLYAPASLQEANLLAALDRPDEAVKIIDRLIAQNPQNADLLGAAGDVLRGAGEYAAAIPYYDKAITALGDPPPPSAWVLFFDRGICTDALGDWDKAEPDMQEALRLSPNQPYVLNYLAYSWALHGKNLDQAKQMLNKAVSLDPNDGAVIDSLGYVTLRQGDTATALSLLIQAVQLDPDDAEVNGHLGDAFWAAGLKLQANYQWQRALALDPDQKLRAELTQKLQTHFGPPS